MLLITGIHDIDHTYRRHNAVLRRCYVPQIFCEIATLMYNAIFIFLERLETMRNAQKTRLGYFSTSTDTIKSLGGMGSNLFLTSLEKSETLQKSLDSRCYTGDLPVYRPDRKKDSYPELVN